MKKVFIFILFCAGLCLSNSIFAQSLNDTLITKNKDSIVCKITKITDYDIEYKKNFAEDAIIYVISKEKVREIHFADGTVEVIKRDELEMNAETEILDKRQAIKFHYFSIFRNYLALTYEKSIKMGTNIESTVGFINNSMFNFSGFEFGEYLTQGVFVAGGPKFNLGSSYYMKGMKYSHPLKGQYFKPELIYTGYKVRNMDYYIYDYDSYNSVVYRTDKNVNGLAVMLNYGNQYILGNFLTFGFNLGVGYSFVWKSYTNKDLQNHIEQNGTEAFSNLSDYTFNMFNHMRVGDRSAVAFSSTITLGYVFK
ncbi:MAG: hypothetical protein A2W93_05720 [Bacteroidetes bacterium GWF2_43_63]|nr:MAG: hypothetical protein A2W94_07345 [Bacteroidetes bacterium GWE2_42_42]OFY55512.1 MAG: hypothetical protein A2W93_05720 [Bacteroidetes bacterium GWF2_43_63]HBG69992.1 hypothetical protein [Bacteroidales bacterium]HCB62583.1 hypothetical protein [Bacteroidales bacterium]HCY23703.1 hypothetical protein [Bacteroidales bacterium]